MASGEFALVFCLLSSPSLSRLALFFFPSNERVKARTERNASTESEPDERTSEQHLCLHLPSEVRYPPSYYGKSSRNKSLRVDRCAAIRRFEECHAAPINEKTVSFTAFVFTLSLVSCRIFWFWVFFVLISTHNAVRSFPRQLSLVYFSIQLT